MDLVSGLASAVGIPQDQAKAVAGLVLGMANTQVSEQKPELAAQMSTAIPEISGWRAAADTFISSLSKTSPAQAAPQQPAPQQPAPQGGLFGDLLSAAGSGFGNQILGAIAGQEVAQGAQLAMVLDRIGLTTEQAAAAAPVVLNFLKSRLDETTVQQIVSAAPLLGSLLERAPGLSSLIGKVFER